MLCYAMLCYAMLSLKYTAKTSVPHILVAPGNMRTWDMVKTFPSVACVLHHLDLDAMVLVRQFRPAVYASRALAAPGVPLSAGFTFELCAGLLDKSGKSVEQTLHEEVRFLARGRLERHGKYLPRPTGYTPETCLSSSGFVGKVARNCSKKGFGGYSSMGI